MVKRIQSLDGIRAFAIFLVLLSHLKTSLPQFIKSNFLFKSFANGHTGVLFFFIISGYLITKLLLQEEDKYHTISLKKFYLRRIFRIFPAYYSYLLVIVLIKLFIFPDIVKNIYNLLFAAVYLWNYKQFFLFYRESMPDVNGGWFLGHTWSLSMEEQFYLIWPFIFLLIKNKNHLVKLLMLLIVLSPVIRYLTYLYIPYTRGQISLMLHTAGDSLMVGCLIAVLENKFNLVYHLQKVWAKSWTVLLAFIYILFVHHYLSDKYRGAYFLTIGFSLVNILAGFLILWAIHVNSFVKQGLNNKWIVKMGVLSYSLYLWQQLFLHNKSSLFIFKFPVNIICCVIVAILSYEIIEKPFLRLKKKFAV